VVMAFLMWKENISWLQAFDAVNNVRNCRHGPWHCSECCSSLPAHAYSTLSVCTWHICDMQTEWHTGSCPPIDKRFCSCTHNCHR
jgi:hypothetical protein